MKKILNILWFAIVAVALSGLLAWLSLFLAWGRIIEVKTGFIVASIIGMIFFVTNTLNTINKK